jgi:hypothetical protein
MPNKCTFKSVRKQSFPREAALFISTQAATMFLKLVKLVIFILCISYHNKAPIIYTWNIVDWVGFEVEQSSGH